MAQGDLSLAQLWRSPGWERESQTWRDAPCLSRQGWVKGRDRDWGGGAGRRSKAMVRLCPGQQGGLPQGEWALLLGVEGQWEVSEQRAYVT